MKESSKNIVGIITGMAAGIVVGGALGLLYAPQSGKETRKQIKSKSGDLGSTIKHKAGDLSESFKSTKDKVIASVMNIGSSQKDVLLQQLSEIEAKIEELSGAGKGSKKSPSKSA